MLVTRTYLTLDDPAALRPATRPAPAATLHLLDPCDTATARLLYHAVGAAWHWRDRDGWSDDRLAEWVARPTVRTYRLDAPDGALLGYAELVRHDDDSCELGYFGLVPDAMGRGLGGAFLTSMVRAAWAFDLPGRAPVTRVWLHTCTLDAPQALPNYLARGFVVFRTEAYAAPE
ncbi:MAG: GNAT family N-acetyltransferase [Gemmatimonadaceae bacterium]|nr:GNAT family N-acetyltransferase [Gemmatimonadaceae bacterium]